MGPIIDIDTYDCANDKRLSPWKDLFGYFTCRPGQWLPIVSKARSSMQVSAKLIRTRLGNEAKTLSRNTSKPSILGWFVKKNNLMKSSGMISLWLASSIQRSPGHRSYNHQKKVKENYQKVKVKVKRNCQNENMKKMKVTMMVALAAKRNFQNENLKKVKVKMIVAVKRYCQNENLKKVKVIMTPAVTRNCPLKENLKKVKSVVNCASLHLHLPQLRLQPKSSYQYHQWL